MLNIEILCNRPGFLVCIKPQGILSEDPGLPALLCRQEKIPVLYPVHRLDQGTGGLMILAKTRECCSLLSESFQSMNVRKQYLAVVEAKDIPDSAVFEDYLFHDRRTNKSYVVKSMRKGVRKASCAWKLLDSRYAGENQLRLVRVELHTGRTHQIRIQFASRGMPLFGDQRYGSSFKSSCPALWAAGLSIPDPDHPQDTLEFCCVPPDSDPWNRFSFPLREAGFRALLSQYDVFPPE